jgi:hypothetical protein
MRANEGKITTKKQQIIETVTLPKTFYCRDQKIINSYSILISHREKGRDRKTKIHTKRLRVKGIAQPTR